MDSASVPDEEILTTIADVYKEGNGYTLDPHSAIGVAAARKARKPNATDVPMIVLACAHWAKFPDANKAALGAEKVRETRHARDAPPPPATRGRRPRRPTARSSPVSHPSSSPPLPPPGGEADGPADPRRPPQARVARQVAAQRRLDRAGLRRGDDGGARRHRRAGGAGQGADGVSGAPRADAPRATTNA